MMILMFHVISFLCTFIFMNYVKLIYNAASKILQFQCIAHATK